MASAWSFPPSSSSMSTSHSSSQSSESPMEAAEQRFAELLKPIKDLTANWEVPLSRYLEKYMEELSVPNFRLEGKVNFVEAALLLQGTASVYSKKVEFLWQNVLKMLDLLASRKALLQGEGEGDANKPTKRGGRRVQHDFNDFRLVVGEMSRHLNLKPTDLEQQKKLFFISVTPRQLIEKEGREQKSVRVNVYSCAAAAAELLGHKEDFRVNAQFNLNTAMVGEDLSSETELAQQSVSLCDTEDSLLLSPSAATAKDQEHPDVVIDHSESQTEVVVQNNDNDDLDDLPNMFDDDNGDMDLFLEDPSDKEGDPKEINGDKEDKENKEEEPVRRSKRRNLFEESLREPKAPLCDPWEPINPHECTTGAVRKIRKGKTCKAPPNIALKRAANAARRKKKSAALNDPNVKVVQVTVPIEEYLITEVVTIKYSHLGRTRGVAVEFQEMAYEEGKERERKNALLRTENEKEENDNNNLPDREEEDDDGGGGGEDGGWEECHFEGGADNDDDDGADLLRPGDLEVAAAMLPLVGDTDAAAAAEESNKDSYEELVMKRVAAYVQQSQAYLESTDLAKRVAKWHEDIRPRLEKVERRHHFDIHKYGEEILSAFPDNGGKNTVDFENFVKGKEKEEVCRYFLSSLMLANTYNVELTPRGEMDKVEMTLLSRKLHHEQFMEEEETASPKKRKNPVKKKKAAAAGGGDEL